MNLRAYDVRAVLTNQIACLTTKKGTTGFYIYGWMDCEACALDYGHGAPNRPMAVHLGIFPNFPKPIHSHGTTIVSIHHCYTETEAHNIFLD